MEMDKRGGWAGSQFGCRGRWGGVDVKTMHSLQSLAKVSRNRKTSCVRASVCVCQCLCALVCVCARWTDSWESECAGVRPWMTGHFLFELTLLSHAEADASGLRFLGTCGQCYPSRTMKLLSSETAKAEGNKQSNPVPVTHTTTKQPVPAMTQPGFNFFFLVFFLIFSPPPCQVQMTTSIWIYASTNRRPALFLSASQRMEGVSQHDISWEQRRLWWWWWWWW